MAFSFSGRVTGGVGRTPRPHAGQRGRHDSLRGSRFCRDHQEVGSQGPKSDGAVLGPAWGLGPQSPEALSRGALGEPSQRVTRPSLGFASSSPCHHGRTRQKSLTWGGLMPGTLQPLSAPWVLRRPVHGALQRLLGQKRVCAPISPRRRGPVSAVPKSSSERLVSS